MSWWWEGNDHLLDDSPRPHRIIWQRKWRGRGDIFRVSGCSYHAEVCHTMQGGWKRRRRIPMSMNGTADVDPSLLGDAASSPMRCSAEGEPLELPTMCRDSKELPRIMFGSGRWVRSSKKNLEALLWKPCLSLLRPCWRCSFPVSQHRKGEGAVSRL